MDLDHFSKEFSKAFYYITNLPMVSLILSKENESKIFENHLNPVMLVFIG